MDNFFSSVVLFEELHKKGTYALGTVRSRAEFPKEAVMETGKARGTTYWTMKNELLAVGWHDTKPVHFLSTCSEPPNDEKSQENTASRRQGESIIEYYRPTVVSQYNKTKGGVDTADQKRSFWGTDIPRLKKWWIQIYLFAFDIAIENSRIIYNTTKKSLLDSKDFRYCLVRGLTGDTEKKKKKRKDLKAIP